MTTSTIDNGIVDPNIGDVPPEKKEDKAFFALKEEKKKLAEKNAAIQAELDKFKQDAEKAKEESLKQQGEYKKLWEDEKLSKAEISEKLKQKEAKELTLRKVDVVMQELGVPLAKAEYWNFMNLDRIPVDEATQDIDVNIAKQVASDFMRDFPELLAKKKGSIPGDAPKGTSSLSYEEWNKLPLADKKARMKDVKK